MKKVSVHASKEYDVLIGAGLLETAGEFAKKVVGTGKSAIITDDIVNTLYADKLTYSLEKSGFTVIKKVFPNGENVKTPENTFEIINFLAENRFTRSDTVFALGGGTIGDLAGFASSVFLRGINLVQLPTTLLAQVDSSVGGKTAVNLKAGKNLAGSFYQPDLVLCDTDTLSSLPENIFNSGCAEVIKYGVIASKELFEKLKDGTKNDLEQIIAECVQIKSDIVSVDEHDRGLRQLLNFGHTAGHAVERFTDFAVSHGEAVAIGMVIASCAAYKSGYCEKNVYDEIKALLVNYNLPVSTDLTVEQLLDSALSDKKREGATISLVIPEYIGKAVTKKVSITELADFFKLGKQVE
ncbi:MAG: 3-dehydroquinate synthase [Clostridiales bacterium GWF2_36_10]|nr:MAG: 3-dehydroquinate synthase [Clostridiales bacterium GWF2_36_10]